MALSGIEAFLEMLAQAGVRYIFGNPGTTELPLNDALAVDPRFEYILGLQEIPVMGMADGFAMASRQIGVVNLHISCGLGNAMGMLYNAHREGTPLLVTVGQQDRRLMFEEPILAGDLVGVAKPWTKWAVEVSRVDDLPVAIRRGIQTALTPPTGPVLLSIPIDVQMERSDALDLSPAQVPDRHVRPPVAALARAAEVLISARRPAILAGSRVTEAEAIDELVTVAEALGAPVYTEPGTTHGRLAFPSDHPLNGQALPVWSPELRQQIAEFDVLLVVGMDVMRQYIYHEPSRAVPEHIRLVQLDEDPWQLGKNYPVEVGLVGDTKSGLSELGQRITSGMSDRGRREAQGRADRYAAAHAAARQRLGEQLAAEQADSPMTPLVLMNALARILPKDVAVIEEAVTTTNTLLERFGALKNTDGYFAHRGWALGWGLGCTLGVKLAWPDRPVLGIIGEGSAMYSIQALWSAAHHRIPATVVIPNNGQYQILKACALQLNLPQAMQGQFRELDITDPQIDFVGLARSLGVEACRVSDADELSERVRESLAGDKPTLIDVPIAGGRPEKFG